MTGQRLPAVSGRRVVQVLKRLGFVVDRVAGSHHLMTHPTDRHRTVTVPVHAGRDLKTGTLHAILRQAGLTVDQFLREL